MSVVLVTGGFDPLHSGHISYFKAAKKLGSKLWVGLNSDEWLTNKKGRPFMPIEERFAIIDALEVVDHVFPVEDCDEGSAILGIYDALEMTDEDIIFANGGDRTHSNIPEIEEFKNYKRVKFEFGVGGEDKINSSSWILEEWKAPKTIRNWGWYRVLEDTPGYKIKELVINPGGSLSMQKHEYRNEHWYILKGSCIIDRKLQVAEKLHTFESTQIMKNQWHKGINVRNNPCHILEVQYGELCEEWDIERDNTYDCSPSLPDIYQKISTKKESS
jgi:cytidyltransferase-like protein